MWWKATRRGSTPASTSVLIHRSARRSCRRIRASSEGEAMMAGRISIAIAVLLAGATLSGMQAQSGSPWGAEYFPNVPLVTQDGKTVHFYDDLIKGKRVLINFVFSSCENVCPLATAKLVQVQKRLGERIGRDIFMYTITLDPEHDSPESLKAYAARYGAGP